MMTEEEAKKLESQKWDILARLDKHRQEKNATKILQNENDFLGKCYKIKRTYEWSNETEILFIKVLSAINRDTYNVHTIDFVLPLSVKFRHRVVMDGRDKFDFCFQDEDLIWFDEHPINELKSSEEIDEKEYNSAIYRFYSQVSHFVEQDFSLGKIFGENYEREVKSLSVQQREEENKEVQEES